MSTTIGSLKVAIDKWCEKKKVDPNCISIYANRGPTARPGVTYEPVEIKELTEILDSVGLTLWLRSKPIKE